MATGHQIFPKILFLLENTEKFSTIFLVNNGHRAIKVHVNKVQYCRAGHKCIHGVQRMYNDVPDIVMVMG